ncbi:MAG: helix-turn-helix domain-containing protein [Betaproteobacteria bacterium]|mgnify:CR=1 FL=1|jgi:IclR family acetate operon transcriptional repressor|nr:helix-turn-helix domain-containing protein [Betaproteobacteria bacterium]MBK6602752.1 helix-turn-helix domain-containing protein [Betaproteobacteria bacterium]MBK7081035.1 helix-turn-helix domain-containing protein [Betaproteobacteria bacterium]MBK7590083.1 helix-turn-helix domain-containing protein [Betaproteobacteria bacterium]MBK7791183.1 helix-turn-helix domain-containing protein [Betaproteobacteria bacterium]
MPHRYPTPPRRGRTPQNPAGTSTGQVQSLTRGLSILEVLAKAEGGLTLTDVTQRVGLPASTTHRLLATLEKTGYVVQAGELGRWYVGLQAFAVGSSFLANRDFVAQSHPYMRRLMEQAGETVNLAILDGTEAVFIDQVQCRETMRTIVKLGSRVPLHASGVGKALFASLRDEQIDAILKVKGLPRITPHTITAPETMWAALRVIRQRGFSFDDEEHLPGTRCVAAPIYDEHGESVAAISIAGPSARLPDERIRQLGLLVAHIAEEVTRRLGGRWPHPH